MPKRKSLPRREEAKVPELTITVNCKSMLISTGFFRFCKGVEQFYYTLLFTAEPYAEAGASPWLSWLQAGFHLAAREAPSAAAEADRLRLDAHPGRTFEIKAASSNGKMLEKLQEVIREIDRIRRNLGDGDDKSRLGAIGANPKIDALLLAPLKNSLVRNSIAADGVQAFSRMLERGLLALCDKQIASIETGLN
jgi:hypothetical protein